MNIFYQKIFSKKETILMVFFFILYLLFLIDCGCFFICPLWGSMCGTRLKIEHETHE